MNGRHLTALVLAALVSQPLAGCGQGAVAQAPLAIDRLLDSNPARSDTYAALRKAFPEETDTFRWAAAKSAGVSDEVLLRRYDEMAAGIVFAARERGIAVPDELSVIGFDDTPIAAHIWPPLTTVRWPIVSMARSAAMKIVANASEEDSAGEPSMFLSTLVRRASVAPPPKPEKP